MRSRLLISMLVGSALAAGALVATGSARTHRLPVLVSLRSTDRFDVSGATVACRVVPKAAPLTSRLICYAETKPGSYRARSGSYAVEFAQDGIAVGRVGSKTPVYVRRETAPLGAPAGSAQATPPIGGRARLGIKGDRAYVAGTNVVCRPWQQTPRAVLCVLLGSNGRVPDGSYLAWISARGVKVAQEQNRKSVPVFQRVNLP